MMKESEPTVSKYLMTAANDRLEKNYEESKKMFMDMAREENSMLTDLIDDYTSKWAREMKEKIKKY